MNEEMLTQNEADLIYLMACGLNQEKADLEYIKNMDLIDISRAARFHTIPAMICMVLQDAGLYKDESWIMAQSTELKKALAILTDKKEKAIRKVMLLDSERNRIAKELDRNHIWYMPLKGVILKEMYPKVGMRQMADNDILFDAAYQEKVKQIMEQNGYDTEVYARGNHDVYKKAPIYNYEMHTALFGKVHDNTWQVYYENVKERMIKDDASKESGSYAYHLSVDDAYIYILTHAYKHYQGSGTGIRTLADIYVYNKVCGNQLDRSYVETECKKLGIYEYEKLSRKVTDKIFDKRLNYKELSVVLNADETEYIKNYFGSGTYGTIHQRILKGIEKIQGTKKQVSGKIKVKYLWKRLFPGTTSFRKKFPFLDQFPILIPFFALYRVSVRAFCARKKVIKELKEVKKLK